MGQRHIKYKLLVAGKAFQGAAIFNDILLKFLLEPGIEFLHLFITLFLAEVMQINGRHIVGAVECSVCRKHLHVIHYPEIPEPFVGNSAFDEESIRQVRAVQTAEDRGKQLKVGFHFARSLCGHYGDTLQQFVAPDTARLHSVEIRLF